MKSSRVPAHEPRLCSPAVERQLNPAPESRISCEQAATTDTPRVGLSSQEQIGPRPKKTCVSGGEDSTQGGGRESNRRDGPGRGNGRHDAGGAARAAGRDKRR